MPNECRRVGLSRLLALPSKALLATTFTLGGACSADPLYTMTEIIGAFLWASLTRLTG
jgi:hypothetical protein